MFQAIKHAYGGNSGVSSEFFGWTVLVLASASELETEARPRKEKKDENRDDDLGVSGRKEIRHTA
jgi:hypothetical protein